jgi:hypothetical protein
MALSSYLLRKNVWLQCFIGIATLIAMMPFTALLHDHVRSAKEKIVDYSSIDPDVEDSEDSEVTSLLTHTSSSSTSNTSILITISSSLIENISHTITLFKSIILSSPFCRTTMLTYFLLSFANAIDNIFAQWSSLTFSWILADVNAVNSLGTLVSFIVLLSLPTLSSIIKPHFGGCSSKVDFFMVKASVIAWGVGVLLMSLAPTRHLLIAAVVVGNFGAGAYDALRGFVTGLLGGKDEIEQFYVGIGIMETVGGMLGTVAWSAVFREVVGPGKWVLRVPFGLCAVLMVGALGCVVVLGRFARRVTKVRDDV